MSRYLEDYAFLKDPACRTEVWDALKYIPLVQSGQAYLSLGADLRERWERLDNPDFNNADRDTSGYFLQRYMLYADAHASEPTTSKLVRPAGCGSSTSRLTSSTTPRPWLPPRSSSRKD